MEEKLPRALPRDVPDYHDRQAAHFRALASTATTAPLKARYARRPKSTKRSHVANRSSRSQRTELLALR